MSFDMECLLGRTPEDAQCERIGNDCRSCGWCKGEKERREALLRTYGLQPDSRGLMHIPLRLERADDLEDAEEDMGCVERPRCAHCGRFFKKDMERKIYCCASCRTLASIRRGKDGKAALTAEDMEDVSG